MYTVSLDFDGVCHRYDQGWFDGTIYGGLMPGAYEAIHELVRRYAVVVQTARSPLSDVAAWLTSKTGIPTVVDTGETRFWNDQSKILVSDRKLPALVYIDDRGYRFENWGQTLLDLPGFEPPRPLPTSSPRP